MKITWVTRSFLDYRIPVYAALDELCGHQLTLIYNEDVIPQRVNRKIKQLLGSRAIGLSGEIRLTGKEHGGLHMANKGLRIPIQKGLIHAIKRTEPDVMVSDGFFQWTYSTLFVRAYNKIPHVMCYERTEHTERNAGRLRTLYRKFVRRWIDAIDCNGSLTGAYVRKLGFKEADLTYGHMAADTNVMSQKADEVSENELTELRKKFGGNGKIFLYVGRLIPLKGLMQMLQSWNAANLENDTLLLVGDGMQREEIKRYISEKKLNNVFLVGAIDYDRLAPYYKVADCFIIPTLEDNWSLVVPEAMAIGLPIASSIYNGCYPELVKLENGWTFDPLNQNDMVEKLLTIAACSKEQLAKMGEASRRIVSNHTPAHAAKGIYEACLKAANKNK